MADQERFQAAYRAWRAATDDYNQALDAVVIGQVEYDPVEMRKKVKEMARLLAEFDAASVGIVRWRRV